jgi:hypothetical protein
MMAGTLRVRRSRGALSGLLLVLLGIWGALIPFVGPYFKYAYTPDRAWAVTSGRMWLDVLPGAVTLVGGLVVLLSRLRPAVVFASWLAALAGAWFAVGDLVARHWAGLPVPGSPVGGAARSALEQLGFFTGVGVVIVFVAALALGRFTVVGVADAKASSTVPATAAKAGAATAAAGAGTAAATRTRTGAWPRVKPVPVFRGRSRSGDSADADATRATVRAD